jgi:hypothetical protein
VWCARQGVQGVGCGWCQVMEDVVYIWLEPSGQVMEGCGLHKYATQYLRLSHLGLNVNRNIFFHKKVSCKHEQIFE